MNQEKLAKLQAQVRIGGKVRCSEQLLGMCMYVAVCMHIGIKYCTPQGSARRKKKVVHRTATADDKKLQFSLKKLGVNNISGIEEVNKVCSLQCAKSDYC